jgi:hypothetical protein
MILTIFTTLVVNTLLRNATLLVLRLSGWTVERRLPSEAQLRELIAAPDTGNLDLPTTVIHYLLWWVRLSLPTYGARVNDCCASRPAGASSVAWMSERPPAD